MQAISSQSICLLSQVHLLSLRVQVADDWSSVAPTGSDAIKPDAARRNSDNDGSLRRVFRGEVSEPASGGKIPSSDNDSTPTSIASVAGTTSTRVGIRYPALRNGTAPEYLTLGTNTPPGSFVNVCTNTAVAMDMLSSTGGRRYETTHVEPISLMSRRANSVPPCPRRLDVRTNHGPPGTERLFRATPTPTNIPDATYQPTSPDGRVDRIRDDGDHVIDRKQVPVGDGPVCTSCLRVMGEEERGAVGSSVNRRDGKLDWTDDGRRQNFQELPGCGNTEAVPDWRATTYQDRAVGNEDSFPVAENHTDSTSDDEQRTESFQEEFRAKSDAARTYQDRAVGKDDDDVVFPVVVERGVGNGTVWTDSRGTGERSVHWRTADASTWTPAVSTLDRGVGTRSVCLVHRTAATDSQLTASVGTSPAEDITAAYRGLLAAAQPRPTAVSRATATPPRPVTVDRQTATEHRPRVDCATSPAVDVSATYRGLLDAHCRGAAGSRRTVSRGTLTAPLQCDDKNTTTDCVNVVDRASSPVKVQLLRACF